MMDRPNITLQQMQKKNVSKDLVKNALKENLDMNMRNQNSSRSNKMKKFLEIFEKSIARFKSKSIFVPATNGKQNGFHAEEILCDEKIKHSNVASSYLW